MWEQRAISDHSNPELYDLDGNLRSYEELARALSVAPGSVGTLLLRATAAFVAAYGRTNHASD